VIRFFFPASAQWQNKEVEELEGQSDDDDDDDHDDDDDDDDDERLIRYSG